MLASFLILAFPHGWTEWSQWQQLEQHRQDFSASSLPVGHFAAARSFAHSFGTDVQSEVSDKYLSRDLPDWIQVGWSAWLGELQMLRLGAQINAASFSMESVDLSIWTALFITFQPCNEIRMTMAYNNETAATAHALEFQLENIVSDMAISVISLKINNGFLKVGKKIHEIETEVLSCDTTTGSLPPPHVANINENRRQMDSVSELLQFYHDMEVESLGLTKNLSLFQIRSSTFADNLESLAAQCDRIPSLIYNDPASAAVEFQGLQQGFQEAVHEFTVEG
ncbi:hypothetical protein UCRPC4_g05395 [Phaeomoniella chlamydospora]|uniref:Uncharacterized protein n=1 Tax=Phaeomoniella chlamydospora TaxID=158046 RepID=A0A0G2E3X9_PHACM|nr:hypothetical protein UCRPC4_g05395 [Phaeomoniella chlamydospora]